MAESLLERCPSLKQDAGEPHIPELRASSPPSIIHPVSNSLAVELLRLLVQGRALLHGDESLHAELLPRLRHGEGPALDPGVGLLPVRALLLAHDPPVLVLHQAGLRQPAKGRLLVATEDNELRELALRELAHTLHGLHRLRRAHRLRHDSK